MSVAVGSTTVMRMQSALTPSGDTAAPASLATWATGPSAEVSLLFVGTPGIPQDLLIL